MKKENTYLTDNPGTIPEAQQTITYTPFNMTASVSDGTYTLGYTYGPDNQRIKSVLANGLTPVKTKYYTYNYEKEIRPSGTREINYINSPYGLVAVVVKENNIYTPYYVETDHLGSIIGLLNNDGTYAERYSFDAWGRRRNPSDWTYNNIPQPTVTDRGYTGHEHLDVFSLINMNGRLYDPVIARFLGADPVLQDQGNSQSFNGYSYCLNNPLKYSDPAGYSAYRDPWTDPTNPSLKQMWQELFEGQYYDLVIGDQVDGGSNKEGDKANVLVDITVNGVKLKVPAEIANDPAKIKVYLERNKQILGQSGSLIENPFYNEPMSSNDIYSFHLNLVSVFAEDASKTSRTLAVSNPIRMEIIDAAGNIALNRISLFLGYGSSGLDLALDIGKSKDGQQSWFETAANFSANIGGMAIGGWWGLGVTAFYKSDKALFKSYINTIINHPNWNPYPYRGFTH